MKRLVITLCALGMLAGCNGTTTKVVPEQPLSGIYDEAYAEFNKKHYDIAARFRGCHHGGGPIYEISSGTRGCAICAVFARYVLLSPGK